MELTRIYRGMENGAEAIEENFDSLEKLLNKLSETNILNVGKKVWSGAWYMGKINQLIRVYHWINVFLAGYFYINHITQVQAQGDNWDLNYVFVPKTHIVEFGGRAVVHHLETLNGAKYNKYIYISNTQILGHKNNNTASKTFCIDTGVCNLRKEKVSYENLD